MWWKIAVAGAGCAVLSVAGYTFLGRPTGETKEVSGRIVIPLIDFSAGVTRDTWRIEIETEDGRSVPFRVATEKVGQLRELTKPYTHEDPPARATVEYKTNYLGRVLEARIVDFQSGWIRQPK